MRNLRQDDMGRIFISYSHKDTQYAHRLTDHLQEMGFDVWIDNRLDYGSQWPHEIEKQLDACDAFVLLMTPRSFASEWVQSELQRAKRRLKPVFPLLLEGEGPWLSVESTQYYDVRNGRVPDDKFYSALKRATSSGRKAPAPFSQSQKTNKETIASRYILPRIGTRGIFGALGCIIVFYICLIGIVPLSQRVFEAGLPFSVPTGLVDIAARPSASEDVALNPVLLSPSLTPALTALPLPVELPDGSTVVMISPFGGEKYQYTVLTARREPLSAGKLLLNLRIRVWTDDRTGMYLGNDAFRLLIGDLRLAPVSWLNEAVRQDVTVDRDVQFEIDASLTDAILLIKAGWNFEGNAKELRLLFPSSTKKSGNEYPV